MVKSVIKRDGSVASFDKDRIVRAISLAMMRTEKGVDNELAEEIGNSIESQYRSKMTVDEIQDMVERKLMSSKRKDAAQAYIKYRQKRDIARQSKTRVMFEEIINTKANEITRENANMNSDTPAGMMMKFASETTKPFVDNYLLCDDVKEAVENNYIHIHDKDYYPTKSLTCLQHPLDIIFKKGFRAGHGELRPPKRIETAAMQACVSMETVQNEMHGGQAIPAFDFYLAPFVRLAYQEEIEKIKLLLQVGKSSSANEEWWDNLKNAEIKDYLYVPEDEIESCGALPAAGDRVTLQPDAERIKQIAINRTVDRVHQSMESFVHNMNNIHSRGGNQVVFSSINYGTDTSAEGRCIIRELLKTTEEGVGGGATAIFPIQIWKEKSGVSYLPGDPNYDLFKYACKVTAKRFFPNFLNLDAPFNQHPKWDINDPERYKYEVATMGALAGKEHLYVKIGEEEPVDISIKDFYEYCKTGELKNARPCQIFCNREPLERVKGDKTNQVHDKLALRESGVYAVTYIPEDVTYIGSSSNINRRINEHKCSIRLTGRMDSGINFADRDLKNYRFEVLRYAEDYKAAEREFIETVPNGNVKGIEQKFYKVPTAHFKHVSRKPSWNQDLTVKQDLIDLEDRDIKVFDRDGKWTKVKHIFKNDKMNTPAMMHVFYEEFGRKYCLDCTEDHPLFTGAGFTRADQIQVGDSIYRMDGLEMKVLGVVYGTYPVDSYDIGTVTGTFIGSDIIMHNCRTRVFGDRFGETTSIGRGNLSFTTLNFPKMAIEAAIEAGVLEKTDGRNPKYNPAYGNTMESEYQPEGYVSIFDEHYSDLMQKNITDEMKQKLSEKAIKLFWEKYEKNLALAAKQLDQRYQFQATALAKQFPLLMSGMWKGSENLKPNDPIEPVLKHGTLGIGFIGLAETLKALTGKHHGESAEAQKLGLEFIKYLDKRCKDFSNQYDHNFAAFATPAEGLAGKFTRVDRKEFGYIKGVLDKDYYTNSNHVPIEYPCTPREKMEIEAAYHPFTPAGHIAYLETDYDTVKNPEAIEDLVKIMHDAGVGYGSINHVVTRCLDCGYEGHEEDFDVCPRCGSTNLTDIQRITGYLVGTTDRWNRGKQAELKNRVIHTGTVHDFIKVKGC